jgi:predicted alpha/beta hydrolase family esterase
MNDIAGIPYFRAEFDINGQLKSPVTLPADVNEVIVVSHGWNNNQADAESLYRALFANFAAIGGAPQGKAAIIGVLWPSKRFDELVAASAASSGGGGAAGIGSKASKESDAMLAKKLDDMKSFFTTDAQKKTLEELKALIPDLQDKKSAQRQFVEKVRSLLDPAAANDEDSSKAFFKDDGAEIMERLEIVEEDFDDTITGGTDGSASLPLGVGVLKPATGGAAGIFGFLSGIKAAAMNVLNFTTYYEMKARAGKVGANGVAKLIDSLPAHVQRIHLVGHSFGGRVVTSAAANSTTDRIRSMSLLQTAFSHHGFSKLKKGFFRAVVDRKRVNGPIVVTHSVKDKAVGIAYPMASRLNGDTTSGLGDKNDKFGGIGRNGAQQMEAGEVVEGKMLATGGAYRFQPGIIFNLEANDLIPGHSDITGKEVAHAIRSAMG